ncbi:PrsW family intramembrane metalloprotease [Streptococcus panodentis]|uniref:PrsW family intramembrane metalloprotease n=1 Tax=Streptococcus panodentis TaxID=1581472 RepID=A0ABS5ATU2_9STRE|nr:MULTISPECIES: PrsW family glutamic-type intramembrane protease [Streptococcus]KXT85795.1 hypothetical protein STRDD11_00206 [Streptococcus sp. DD11]MBP2619994.1 PrsW family intramembrane metalloprotease [Streptococcus panodentis]
MKKQIILLLFLVLAAVGLDYETQAYTYGSMSGTSYGIVGLAALLALLYIIPALLTIRYLGRKWQTPPQSLAIALLGGLFIAGWTSGLANTYIHEWVSANFPNTLISDLENALAAPLVEEPLKLLAVGFALYLAPVKQFKSILLVGITAGMGFQISEDFSYILSDLPQGFSYTISGILGRITGGIASHWLYTGLTALGLALMLRYAKTQKTYFRAGLFYFLAAFVLHFLWNSPLTAIETDIPIITPAMTALAVYLFYQACRTIRKMERDEWEGEH